MQNPQLYARDIHHAQDIRDLFYFSVVSGLTDANEHEAIEILRGLSNNLSRLTHFIQASTAEDMFQRDRAHRDLLIYINKAERLWPNIRDQVPPTKLAEVFSSPTYEQQLPLPTQEPSPTPLEGPDEPVKLFYSSSNAKQDEKLLEMLEKHLSVVSNLGIITEWDRRKITPGKVTEQEASNQLNAADIILILLSSDYLHDSNCYNEMQRAMTRHKANEAIVIPVLLRPVHIPDDPEKFSIAKLAARPNNGKPITSWNNKDEAFTDVAKGIYEAANMLKSRRRKNYSTSPTTAPAGSL